MQHTVVFGEGQIAHSWLAKADHCHMGRWHILPLMSLQPCTLLMQINADVSPKALSAHIQCCQVLKFCSPA